MHPIGISSGDQCASSGDQCAVSSGDQCVVSTVFPVGINVLYPIGEDQCAFSGYQKVHPVGINVFPVVINMDPVGINVFPVGINVLYPIGASSEDQCISVLNQHCNVITFTSPLTQNPQKMIL